MQEYRLGVLPCRASLQLPQSDKRLMVPQACRSFAPGEIVETSYCLAMKPGDLEGSYAHSYLYPYKNQSLWAFGWGMLYGRCPAQDGANLFAIPFEKDGFHYVAFKALRPIFDGEFLFVSWAQRLEPLLSAAEYEFCLDPTQNQIAVHLPEECSSAIEVRQSAIHGMGLFATRKITKGEVCDASPAVPLEQHVDLGLLQDYCFEGDTGCTYDVQLGFASMANHNSDKSKVNIDRRACPVQSKYFVVYLVASQDIEENEELFHDYGADWFKQRDIEVK